MTKVEKIGIGFSATALIISIISPIATYYWLDPNIKAFNNRARVRISIPGYGEPLSGFSPSLYTGNPFREAKITNLGNLPAKDVQVVIEYKETPPIGEDDFRFSPPLQYEAIVRGNDVFITLKRAIPTTDSVSITFLTIPPTLLTVSTEYGETHTVRNSIFEKVKKPQNQNLSTPQPFPEH